MMTFAFQAPTMLEQIDDVALMTLSTSRSSSFSEELLQNETK